MINPDLMNILICPSCGSALRDKETHIECTACKNRFPIENGIPVLMVDRAEKNKR
ncbi:MAG: Trm112 family protein [bacterium]